MSFQFGKIDRNDAAETCLQILYIMGYLQGGPLDR